MRPVTMVRPLLESCMGSAQQARKSDRGKPSRVHVLQYHVICDHEWSWAGQRDGIMITNLASPVARYEAFLDLCFADVHRGEGIAMIGGGPSVRRANSAALDACKCIATNVGCVEQDAVKGSKIVAGVCLDQEFWNCNARALSRCEFP